jgi:dipeptidyl aminopeptidase/acylaminoacyl peptidase
VLRSYRFLLLAGIFCFPGFRNLVSAEQPRKLLTVADDIGVSQLICVESCVRFSPDRNFFVVYGERGRADLNQVEDFLRFYRTKDIDNFVAHPNESRSPTAAWVVSRFAKDAGMSSEGVIGFQWRWLADSSGVAFLERASNGNQQLLVADLQKKKVETLTPATENVEKFDIRDRKHYAYTASRINDAEEEKELAGRKAPAIAGAGLSIEQLLLPDDPVVIQLVSKHTYDLWAVMDGKRVEVTHDGAPVVAREDLVLSPDGWSLITEMPVAEVPKSWETLYPPPYTSSAWRIRGGSSANNYVLINLETGAIKSLTDAPTSWSGGWDVLGDPSWSSDGKEVVLPGTFIQSKASVPTRPCVAVVDLSSNTRTCVEDLKARTATGVEEGFHRIFSVQFAPADRHKLFVTFQKHGEAWFSLGTTEYERTDQGAWQVASQQDGMPPLGHEGLTVTVKQGLNEPPLVVASTKEASRVIWDPNPQLKSLELGEASIYTWKDRDGRSLRGGLYKPPDFKAGQHYPLVIQTHGFDDGMFEPSGSFPTAFAARELAAAGIMVLQSEDGAQGCASSVTSEEGPCAVLAYESAAKQLVADGLVDPERIGIIGFSRSCFYVMQTLTTGSLQFKAASVTDGVMFNYMQYILNPERMSGEAHAIIGAPPFGKGLEQWFKRSPGFNLDKVSAPLRVVAVGPVSLLDMWEPYAGLHYLKKPADLIMLNATAHVLSNPAERMAAQSGTVDWFRFWLQGYEDPDPAKAEQYKRWRDLRKMQAENDKKSASEATQVSH